MAFFHSLKQIFLHIVLLKCPHIQIAFLKFTSSDNQDLVGCIPIPHKMYSDNILNFHESTTILNGFTKKSGNLLKALRIWHIGYGA